MSKLPHQERTFVMLKPDAVQRGLIGETIKRFEATGLKCSAYNKDEAWFMKKGTGIVENLKAQGLPVEKEALEYGKDIIRANAVFMMSAPVVAMVWEGNQAIAVIKKIVGSTEPATSDVGTVRGDYTVDSYSHAAVEDRAVRNLIHCTDPEDGPDEAEREINLWMKEVEVMNYATAQERIMYDVNFDGVTE